MASLNIVLKLRVVREASIDGQILGVHILPNMHSTHLVVAGECWCAPTASDKLADELSDYPGACVWVHHNFKPKWG